MFFTFKRKKNNDNDSAISNRDEGTKTHIMNGRKPDYLKLNDRIQQISKKYKAIGLSLAVVRDGKIEWTISYGYSDKEMGIAANTQTVYRIASISKTVTAMALMTLYDKGLVELDSDISSYLEFQVVNPYFPDKHITLRSLLTHTSSISDYGTYIKAVESGKDFPLLTDMLITGRQAFSMKNFYHYDPESKNFAYSNFGYGIIAAVIESITGKRFSDYVRECLFEPLQLDASFLPSDISDSGKIANIYRGNELSFSRAKAMEGKERISRLPIGQLYILAPGNLYISADDLAKLMIVLMKSVTHEERSILSSEAVDMMNKTQSIKSSDANEMRGLGLHITDSLVKGRCLRGHQGRAYGATSEMFYDISDKTGVVYLSNGSKDVKARNGFTVIGSEIVNAVYDCLEN